MFTGIVAGKYSVCSVEKKQGFSYCLNLGGLAQGLEVGASVAVDGVCQTSVSVESGRVTFDAIDETLRCTTLGQLRVGSEVNVERSLTMGAELGGHLLSGHVVGTAEILGVPSKNSSDLVVGCPKKWLDRILSKGFIAINGVSLTVGAVEKDRFRVHLIPETLRTTNLGDLKLGQEVNLELDHITSVVVDTVNRLFAQHMELSKK